MTVEAMTLALNHSKSEGIAKLILIGIANHDGDGGAWPSIATLARYANVTSRTVQKHINTLIELGEIERIMNDGGTHHTPNHMRPNLYKILLRCPANCDGTTQHRMTNEGEPPPVQSDTPRPVGQGTPVQRDTPPLSSGTPEPSFNHPSTVLKESSPSVSTSPELEAEKDFLLSLGKTDVPDHPNWMTPDTAIRATEELSKIGRTLVESVQSYYAGPLFNGKPDEQVYKQWKMLEIRSHVTKVPLPVREVVRTDTAKTLSEAFGLFWQAYPKKQKKTEALNEFTAAVKSGVAADLIITGAKRFARAEGAKDQQYLPFPGTWLRDGRWADEYKTKSWSHTASDD